MPIRVKEGITAVEKLKKENIFAMTNERAIHQDIRELSIAVVNLMPDKEETEEQILRLLSNSPLQTDVTFVRLVTHKYKNTAAPYLLKNYCPFYEIENRYYDGLIITGAPVERLGFEEVDYWGELSAILEWSRRHVTSTLYISWAAQAGLYYHYGVTKHDLDRKLSGIFRHEVVEKNNEIVRGLDRVFNSPHSTYTGLDAAEIDRQSELSVIARTEAGEPFIITDGANVFIDGHPEYDIDRLAYEYERDKEKGLTPGIPENYFPGNDPTQAPVSSWISVSGLLFQNWLNYYVYQVTPYELGGE